MNSQNARLDRRLLFIAIIITLASLTYHINANITNKSGSDTAAYNESFYFNQHYPNIAYGLQQIVFGNHIAPDLLLISPLYWLFQTPLVLLILQSVVVCGTALLIFICTARLAKDQRLALAFCIAFLVSPGVYGLLILDFHAEAFIPFFYILTFYFYAIKNRLAFLVSTALLLGTMESSVFIALSLGIGLLLFARTYKGNEAKDRSQYAYYLIAMTLAAAVIYYTATVGLVYAYNTGLYAGLPGNLYVTHGLQNTIFLQPSGLLQRSYNNLYSLFYPASRITLLIVLIGIIVTLFAYGILILSDPLITLVLLMPWLLGIVIVLFHFAYLWNQYSGFELGGTYVAALIGYILLNNRRKNLLGKIARRMGIEVKSFVVYTSFLIPVLMFVIWFFCNTYIY